MVAKYPSNVAKSAPSRRARSPSRPDYQRPVRPAGPPRRYSLQLPPLPYGQLAKFALRRIAPKLVPYVGQASLLLDAWELFQHLNPDQGQPLYTVNKHKGWLRVCYGPVPPGGTAPYNLGPVGSNSGPASCSGTAEVAVNDSRPNGPTGSDLRWYWTFKRNATVSIFRARGVDIIERWDVQPGGSAATWNTAVSAPLPMPGSFVYPRTSPIAWPAFQPMPAAMPTPKELRSPEDEPSERPEETPNWRPKPGVRPDSRPRYDLPPVPAPVISNRAPVEIEVLPHATTISSGGPGKPPRVDTLPSEPQDKQPPRRVVQRKTNVAVVGGLLWTGIQSATEAMDFIKAAHDAIPEGGPRLSKKASKAQIIEYMLSSVEPWKHVDVAEALQNIINEQIADYVAAFGSDNIKRLQQEQGQITGLDRALREASEPWNVENIAPQLDIDMDNGRVSLRSPYFDVGVSWK